MNKQLAIILAMVGTVIVLVIVFVASRLAKKRRQPQHFAEKWLEIQRLCSSKETWGLAVINADKLLDSALKSKRAKGKSMGERLVSVQRELSDNDAIWFAHKLAKKLLADTELVIREAEAKKSLVGIRQALRDLGVLNGK